jgi:hypothetical protein
MHFDLANDALVLGIANARNIFTFAAHSSAQAIRSLREPRDAWRELTSEYPVARPQVELSADADAACQDARQNA